MQTLLIQPHDLSRAPCRPAASSPQWRYASVPEPNRTLRTIRLILLGIPYDFQVGEADYAAGASKQASTDFSSSTLDFQHRNFNLSSVPVVPIAGCVDRLSGHRHGIRSDSCRYPRIRRGHRHENGRRTWVDRHDGDASQHTRAGACRG